MRYTVVYEPLALLDLPRLWMAAADRQAVTNAANDIDRLLCSSPTSVGTPFGSFRRMTVSPLEVLYNISPDDRMVRVYTLRFATRP
jgi:hypothetical protein